MKSTTFKSDALLLLTAIIWGLAFVAQRLGMEYVGPFTFNGVRFLLGSLVLVPFAMRKTSSRPEVLRQANFRKTVAGGFIAGMALFAGASLQQVGLVYTTAGKAGFITGLYVVIVPILGLFFRQQTHWGTWIGALAAAAGLYLLSVTEHFTIAFGDLLELAGAFFWAGHVLIIGWLSPRMNPIRLALVQFVTCGLLSMLVAAGFEEISAAGLRQAAIPIFYGGALSVGIAYTLQVVAQRKAHPAHAAILLSLEAVFAALGGWLVLEETLNARGLLGCGLMLSGMLISQLWTLMRLPLAGGTSTLKQSLS